MRTALVVPAVLVLLEMFSIGVGADRIFAQSADEFYTLGVTQLEAEQIEDAIESFKKAIKKKYKFPDAHNMLARAYLARGDVIGARKKAEFAVNHAIEQDRKNTKYIITLADVYEQQLYPRKRRVAIERALKIDPECVPALRRLAAYYTKRFYDYAYKEMGENPFLFLDKNLVGYITGEKNSDAVMKKVQRLIELTPIKSMKATTRLSTAGGNNSLENYTLRNAFFESAYKEMLKGIDVHKKLLKLHPDDRDARYELGGLLYDSGKFEEFTDLYKSILADDENDTDALLFLGLGYARLGEHDSSFIYYDHGLATLTPEERALYDNVDFINPEFDNEEWRDKKLPQTADSSGIWLGKDPLYLTRQNERKYEHYGRVAEANLRFYVPVRNIPGWMTGRGRILIRYGRPNSIAEYSTGYLGEGESTVDIRSELLGLNSMYDKVRANPFSGEMKKPSKKDEQMHSFQFWYYDEYTFVFSTRSFDLAKNFELVRWQGIDLEEVEDKVFEEHPDGYKYKPKGQMFSFPVSAVQFRGASGRTHVRLHYSIPLGTITYSKNNDHYSGSIEEGLFWFDDKWNQTTSFIDTSLLNFPIASFDTSQATFLNRSLSLNKPEGDYNFAIEMRDPISGNTGSFRAPLDIRHFGFESLMVSDILVAHTINVPTTNTSITLSNIAASPNPSHAFSTNAPIWIYFEVYNLQLRNSGGRYRTEASIYPADDNWSLKNLISGKSSDETVTISSEMTTDIPADNNVLKINHDIAKPGDYLLQVRITDLRNNSTVVRTTKIFLY